MEKLVNFFYYCIINHKKTKIAKSKYSKKYLAGKKLAKKNQPQIKIGLARKETIKKLAEKNWQKNKFAEKKMA